MSRAAMKQALDALETVTDYTPYASLQCRAAIEALRAALDTPQPEPVAWQFQDRGGKWCDFIDEEHRLHTVDNGSWPIRALYTAPPKETT